MANENIIVTTPEQLMVAGSAWSLEVARMERDRCRKAICGLCKAGVFYRRDTQMHGYRIPTRCEAAAVWDLEIDPSATELVVGGVCEVKMQLAQGDETWAMAFVVALDDNFVDAAFTLPFTEEERKTHTHKYSRSLCRVVKK